MLAKSLGDPATALYEIAQHLFSIQTTRDQ
jgi:hypothetical protein